MTSGDEGQKHATISVRLSVEERGLLERLSVQEDRSAGAVLRVALRAYASQQLKEEERPAGKPKAKRRP